MRSNLRSLFLSGFFLIDAGELAMSAVDREATCFAIVNMTRGSLLLTPRERAAAGRLMRSCALNGVHFPRGSDLPDLRIVAPFMPD